MPVLHRLPPHCSPNCFRPAPPPPTANDSGVSATVSVSLAAASDFLTKSLPHNLDSGSDKINVPANITIMVPTQIMVDVVTYVPRQVTKMVPKSVSSTCKKAGIFGWLFFPCQIINQVQVTETVMDRVVTPTLQTIQKATTIKSPLNVDLTHNVYLDSITLSAEGNQLIARAQISYDISMAADAKVITVGLMSCGVNEAKPEISITEPIHVHWSVDGQLIIDKEPAVLDWTKPCNLTAADLDLKTILRITGVQHQLDDKVTSALSKIPPEMDLGTSLNSLWSSMEAPQPLAQDVWLSINPAGATVSDPFGQGQLLGFSVGVLAHPTISYGAKPIPPPQVRPPLEHIPAPDTFAIELEGEGQFEAIEKELMTAVGDKDLKISGHLVRISQCQLYTSGSNIVIAITFKKPFRATIYLFGTPVFNKDTNIFSVGNLDYTVETRNVLVKIADWLLHSTFQSDIQQKAQVPTATYFVEAKNKLSNYHQMFADNHVSLDVQASDFVVESVFPAKSAIHGRILIRGKASASVK